MPGNPKMTKNTLVQKYEETRAFLEANGFENPDLEAKLLFEHVFGPKAKKSGITKLQESHFLEHFHLLEKNMPIQRQIGYTKVNDAKIKINEYVLLPGPEINVLLGACFDYLQNPEKIIDLCTGCGVIATVLGKKYPAAKIYATDISEKALQTAIENSVINRTKNVSFMLGDLFNPLDKNKIYGADLLVSNPPYCKTGEISTLPAQVRDFTPKIAIDGGQDGLSFHKTIINNAQRYLKKGGLLVLENEVDQSPILAEYLNTIGYKVEETRKNHRGEERVIIARGLQ
jgi:release factor glutamine methyltransferase